MCKRLPGTDLCIKHYRDDDEVCATVRREIARGRFNRRLNTCAQEYDYLQELRKKLPPEIVAVFPETFELRNDEKIGWHLVESLVLNGDGSIPQRFSVTCRAASPQVRARLLSAFRNLMHAFERAAVRFYDPQNIIVQWPGRPLEGESFRLRIVDFEPASRTLLPIDSLLPVFCRMKLRRRVKRYLLQHVQVRYNPLPWRERAAWDDHIAKEGGKIGLADCHAFLENKFVNDIFYEGQYNGLPCVVKCSSRAPESIANEYELALRLHSVDPVHFPEAFACCRGRRAFVIMEKVQGGRSLADVRAEEYSADVLAIVDALYEAKVLFRDMQPPNFLVGLDGRLKLIDFQFAMDMKSKRMDFDPWLCRHPVYHYLVFATALSRDKAHWDDAEFAMCLSPAFREALLPRLGRLRLEVSVSPFVRLVLRAQKIILLAQRVLSKKGSRKRAALDRRLGRLKW